MLSIMKNLLDMGALTLNINNLHSCLGTADIIEIDDTRLSLTGFEGTFKN